MLAGANFVPVAARVHGALGDHARSASATVSASCIPGPMNRGVEIDARVADSDASLVVDQVRSGLVVRMAVLYDLLTTGPVAVESAVEVA